MSNIQLSSWLLEKIQRGESILFLGAGATIGAKDELGKNSPTGNQLRDLTLCSSRIAEAILSHSNVR